MTAVAAVAGTHAAAVRRAWWRGGGGGEGTLVKDGCVVRMRAGVASLLTNVSPGCTNALSVIRSPLLVIRASELASFSCRYVFTNLFYTYLYNIYCMRIICFFFIILIIFFFNGDPQ